MSLIKNGHYELTLGTIIGSITAAIELRDGQFSGQTQRGSAISGNYQYDPARSLYRYNFAVDALPHTPTLFGFTIGEDGRRFSSSGEATASDGEIRFSVGVIGRAVDIAMRYVRPLAGAA
jgi:hypothetical protein